MLNFYEWLKKNKEKPLNVREVRSTMIKGYFDLPMGVTYEKEIVKLDESIRLKKMEDYVNAYTEVTDRQFDEMLEDKHLSKYKALADECGSIDGGIASDLRNHGWFTAAVLLAHSRNTHKEFMKLWKLEKAAEPSTFEKLSKFVMSKLGLKKEVTQTNNNDILDIDDTMQR